MIPSSFAIVGAGSVGTSLATRLDAAGLRVTAVQSRTIASAEALARVVYATALSPDAALPEDVDAVFLCTPDEQLTAVAQHLSERRAAWEGVWVAHVSGALTVEALAPLANRGAATLGWHPLQTFPRRFDPAAFDGCYIGIEGTGPAEAIGVALARALGSRPMNVPTADKQRYHLAASMASNYLASLLSCVDRLSRTRSSNADWTLEVFEPLVRRTLENVIADGPQKALTGPLVRGDASTVARHLRDLDEFAPAWRDVYVALARATVAFSVEAGRITPEVAARLKRAVEGGSVSPPAG